MIAISPILSWEEFEAQTLKSLLPGFKLRASFVHDLIGKAVPKRNWTLKNALLAGTMHLIIGEPGCGKSFLSLDLAATCSWLAAEKKTGEWFGRKCKPCGVVYLAGEGQDDFIIRIHAWLQEKGLPPDYRWPFLLIPVAVDLRSEAAQTDALIEDILTADAMMKAEFGVGVELVFIDTVNKSLAGGDDVKSEVVGAFLRNCTKIRDATGATTVGIHHTVKAGGTVDPRGHGSLKGDNDGQWFVSPAFDGRPNRWAITRMKAGPTGGRHEFRLRPRDVSVDDDGEPITSLTVVPLGEEPSMQAAEMHDAASALQSRQARMTDDGRVILGGNLTIVMRALSETLDSVGADVPFEARAPHGRKGCTMAQWFDSVVRLMPGDDKEDAKFKDRCRKARDAAAITLANRSIIGIGDKWVWRTGRRVFQVDEAISVTPPVSSVSAPENSAAAAALSELDEPLKW